MDYQAKLAGRTADLESSAIREIFKALASKNIISLAGGAPAPESFPVEQIRRLAQDALERWGAAVLQYGITEGFPPLQAALSDYLRGRQIEVPPQQIGISTGAQGALDAAAKILIDPGDTVAVESPSFLGAIKNFKSYQCRLLPLATDDEGVQPEAFASALREKRVKFTYLIPNFQNPSGRTLSLERRHEIAAIAVKYGALILEDDPYYELRYQGEALPPLQSLAPAHVIYLGSLSKILAPGLRLGYYVAPPELSQLMTSVRQGVDVHANLLAQAIAAEYISGGHLQQQLPHILDLYRPRLAAMLASLAAHLPTDFSWSRPAGGMFVWVSGPATFNSQAAYQAALQRQVAFVPGAYFYSEAGRGLNTLRLNFTNVSPEQIEQAIIVLGEVFARLETELTGTI